jgi:radical SAM protein with 4Fe4S-binding SPASM domain
MCGRRKIERDHPELCNWGDIPIEMVQHIAQQVPFGTVVQFHNNGDPLVYPNLGLALDLFKHCFRQFDTNAKLLIVKASEIIDNLDILTISVIENDPEGDEQYEIVKKFLDIRGNRRPNLVYRILGRVSDVDRWQALPGKVAKRVLHSPDGSRDYQKQVTIPEIGVCLDLLTHLAIDRYGNISMCVRFDPEGYLRLGNISTMTLEQAWNSPKRQAYLDSHFDFKREIMPGCDRCDFYGIPRGE